MADRYSDVLGKQLFVWSGWVFKVGGAIGSFVLGQGFAWIGWLAVLTGVFALTAHSYAMHRRCGELEKANTRRDEQLREAERKLNEIPLDLVTRIQEIIAPQSITAIAVQLATHADYVLRMRQFMAVDREIHLRTFTARDKVIFAVAKIAETAFRYLREKDLFVLLRSAEGLQTECALMVVHQTPDPTHGTIHFRLVNLITEEARAIEHLATAGGASGLMGYTLRPVCDTGWYSQIESATIPEAIKRFGEGLERERSART